MGIKLKLAITSPKPFDIDELAAYTIAQQKVAELNKVWEPHRDFPSVIEIPETDVYPVSINQLPEISHRFKVFKFKVEAVLA